VRVTRKTLRQFYPKNHEERSEPLPATMIEQLLEWKAERKAAVADLVFPNTLGKPDSPTGLEAPLLRQLNSFLFRTPAVFAMQENRRRSIKLDEENSHPTLDALRPLEQVLPNRR
jgi:hypothetical protein